MAVATTTSPAAIAAVVVAGQAPLILFGLPSGAIADRVDRRHALIVVHGLRTGIMLVGAGLALVGALSIPTLAVMAFLVGTGETFFESNAQSILPLVVSRTELGKANARVFGVETMMSTFLGPPLGAVLVSLSVALTLGAAALAYLAAAATLWTLTGAFRGSTTADEEPFRSSVVAGLRLLASSRPLLVLSLVSTMGRFGSAVIFAMLPILVVSATGLAAPPGALAGLFVCQGIGSLVGAATVDRLVQRIGLQSAMILATAGFGVCLTLPAIAPSWPIAVAGMFGAGLASMVWNVSNLTLRQSIAPPAFLGRLAASHRFVSNVGALVGGVVSGVIGETFGFRAAIITGGLVVVVGAAIIPHLRSRSDD